MVTGTPICSALARSLAMRCGSEGSSLKPAGGATVSSRHEQEVRGVEGGIYGLLYTGAVAGSEVTERVRDLVLQFVETQRLL